MTINGVKFMFFNVIVAINIHGGLQCPGMMAEAKATYKSGEIPFESDMPITLDVIKNKLRDSGIFDWQDKSLPDKEKKEMNKLFEAVEIMTTSRARQPSVVQNIFASLRVVERAAKKLLKEGQISDSLAAKFKWDKLLKRKKRGKPTYYFNRATNMRVFYTR